MEEIDTACRERLEIIEKAMMQQEGVTEALKAADQMAWVRSLNSIHNRAEESESHFKYGFSAGLIVQQEAHEQLQNKK